MLNKKFAVTIAWSQTDQETFLVYAKSKLDAKLLLAKHLKGYKWITGISECKYIINKNGILNHG